jgi:predicted DNA-binding protein
MNNRKSKKSDSSKPDKVKTFCLLPQELFERLRFESFSERKTRSTIVEEALQEYFHSRDYIQEGA